MFTVSREEIAKFAKKLSSVVTSKSSSGQIPYFAGIKITGEGDWLLLKVYGHNIEAEAAMKKKGVDGSFTFGTRAEQFFELIQALPKSAPEVMFAFTNEADKILVKSGGSKFSLRTYQDDIFPLKREIDTSSFSEIPLGDLIDSLKKVSYCRDVSTKDDVTSYRGLICVNKDHFVATDGYRLSYTPNDVVALQEGDEGLLLSADKVDRLLKIYDRDKSPGKVLYNKADVMILGQGILTIVRRSNSKYPNYQSILPKESLGFVVLDRAEVLSALDRSLIFSSSFKAVKVSLLPTGNVLISSDSEHGSANEQVICKDFSVPDLIEFNLNGKFLLESFKNRSTELIRIEYRTIDEPIVVTGDNHRDIILPIREKGQ